MSVVAAAIIPHSPLLLPGVSKKHAGLLSLTQRTVNEISGEIYAAKPDVIVIITPHGIVSDDVITVHANDQYISSFQEFGDITTTWSPAGAPGIAHKLKSLAEHSHLPVTQQTYPTLDYGSAITSYLLLRLQPQIPIIPLLIPPHAELALRFASVIHDFFTSFRGRAVLVGSADFSRRQPKVKVDQQKPTPEERTISSAITSVEPSMLSAFTPQQTTCGYIPTLVLLSAIHPQSTTGTIRSFEAPLGVGLLTATIRLRT